MNCFRPAGVRLGLLCAAFLASLTGQVRGQDLTLQEEETIQQVVETAAPFVARVETVGGLEGAGDTGGAGPTSGLIVSEDGFIVASAYPFLGMPSAVLVTLPHGQRVAGKIVATDHSRNLVLLKVESSQPLKRAPPVKRSEVRVGQLAVAVGRVYSAERLNVSTGIISATHRIWSKAIQTDAKISPANYGGPLLDIRGKVLGVLTPMSPQNSGAAAGAEWYDSGIGFAAPLEDIYANLERWKQGDLHKGVLGAAFGKDMYASAVKVEAVRAKSPAKEAGLQTGDVIVEVNGAKTRRLAQFRHALGPLYAGDTVNLVVTRGEEKKRVPLRATLVEKLIPYEHPFLGVLPSRSGTGLVVRWVYPDSPADQAGIEAGDRVVSINGNAIDDLESALRVLAEFEAKGKTKIAFERGDKKKEAEVTFAELPTAAPGDLPEVESVEGEPNLNGVKKGFFDVKIPEEASECAAYAPEDYDPRKSYGVLALLTKPGEEGKATLETWKSIADQHHLILLAPSATNPRGWSPPDVEFVIKTIEATTQTHSIDPARIAILGETSGAAVGYLAINSRRDLIHGLVMVNGALPRNAPIPENEPLQRLAFFNFVDDGSPAKAAAEAAAEALGKKKFPVHVEPMMGKLSAEQREQLGRWLDSLDRI